MKSALIAGLIFLPGVALAAPRTLSDLADLALVYIDAGIGIAFILGIVVFFFGVTTGLSKSMSGKASDLRTTILWGIIALFIMFSVWGILALLRNTLFGGGGYASYSDDDLPAICAGTIEECTFGSGDN